MTRLDERFADWVDGRLRPAERDALEAELARDPALQREAENYRRTVQLLRGALAPEEMGASVADSVMTEIGEVARRPLDRRPPRNWRPFLASLVAAAALILVFAVLHLIPPASPGATVDPVAKAVSAGDDDEELLVSRQLQVTAPEGGYVETPSAERDVQAAPSPVAIGARKPAVRIRLPDGSTASSAEVAAEAEEAESVRERVAKELAERSEQPTELDKAPVPRTAAPADQAGTAYEEPPAEAKRKGGDMLFIGRPPESRDQADPRPEALLRDELGLGDLAIVVQFDAAVAARVRADLERRTAALSAAEVLAVCAAPVEGETRGGGGDAVDLRGIPVEMLDRAAVRFGMTEPPPARERTDAELLSWGDLASSDRVLLLSGTAEQLRSFSAMLQARLSPPVGSLSYRRVGGSLASVVGDARSRLDGAGPPGPGAGRAAPSAPGPATPGPTPGPVSGAATAKSRPRSAPGAATESPASGSARLSLYLVLRFPQ
jgi:hypothetical protein